MYGKQFASMYTGSMMGAGSPAFAVMGYVIANMRPDKNVGAQVELNPKLLAAVIGDSQEVMERAIAFLCKPDPESRTPDEDGRRLIKVGVYDYRVVNGPKYLAIRNEEERREQNRMRQADYRAKKSKKAAKVPHGTPLPGETGYVKGVEDGTIDPNTHKPINPSENVSEGDIKGAVA